MCNGCVHKEYPDRGNTCLENGSYLMNYLGCANCHQRDFVLISNKATEDDDGEEIVTYDRKAWGVGEPHPTGAHLGSVSCVRMQSSSQFSKGFTLIERSFPSGAEAPLTRPRWGPVLRLSVSRGRGARQARRRAAAPLQSPALAELLSGGGGA
ncbi:hypothetical protein GOODEAATRI_012969 [Goodea atripinnis]|uniref:Protein Churchill n=1 Tax=Goodea atripinnis TaxID=208336 RepID=A0ABV0PXK5_9TELE